MGPDAKKAVAALTRVLETTDELEGGHDLLVATADALGSIGKPAKSALGALAKARKRNVSPDVINRSEAYAVVEARIYYTENAG